MEIDPPMVNRTTEQLVEIWETKNEWRPDVGDSDASGIDSARSINSIY